MQNFKISYTTNKYAISLKIFLFLLICVYLIANIYSLVYINVLLTKEPQNLPDLTQRHRNEVIYLTTVIISIN